MPQFSYKARRRTGEVVEGLLDTRAIPFPSRPGLLHDQWLPTRRNIVVCGTHGKTTTTALAAFLLCEAAADPGWLIGGVPLDPPTAAEEVNLLEDPGRPLPLDGARLALDFRPFEIKTLKLRF